MIIRPETPDDEDAIRQVTLAVFTGKFSDNPNEHLIMKGLRAKNQTSRLSTGCFLS